MKPDKNLKNVVEALDQTAVTDQQEQQLNQKKMDRRKEMVANDDGYKENQNSYQ